MTPETIKASQILLLFSLQILTLTCWAVGKDQVEHCEGYLTQSKNGGLHLAYGRNDEPFRGISWCDASFNGEIERKLLLTCVVGDKCRVSGLIEGHGTFSWTQLLSVSKVKQPKQK